MDPIFASSIFLFGLCFGSFLNVCIYRLPLDLSVVTPRSACPKCKHGIAFYDNLPVLSWLILGGRCRYCKTKISPRYVFIELLTAVLFLACYWHFGMTLATLKYCVFGFLLLGLIFTDAETKLLPDKLTLPGLALGVLFSLLVPVHDVASQFMPGIVSLPLSDDLTVRLLSWSIPCWARPWAQPSSTAQELFTCAGAARKAWDSATSSSWPWSARFSA